MPVQLCYIQVLQSLFDEKRFFPQNFRRSLDVLQQLYEGKESLNSDIASFLQDYGVSAAEGQKAPQAVQKAASLEDVELRETLNIVKQLFVQLDTKFCNLTLEQFEVFLELTTDQQITLYIQQLESSILLRGNENLQKFFVFVAYFAVNNCLQSEYFHR